jgi:hypothetical protein
MLVTADLPERCERLARAWLLALPAQQPKPATAFGFAPHIAMRKAMKAAIARAGHNEWLPVL